MRKEKINYGKKDLVGGPVAPSEEMVRISIMMEGDLLDALKTRAAAEKRPYQTMIKDFLRQQLGIEGKPAIDREEIRRIVEEIMQKAPSMRKPLSQNKPSRKKRVG
jgi:hypothetical protein